MVPVAAFEIEVVRLGVARVGLNGARRQPAEFDLQGLDNRLRDIFLDLEDIVDPAVIALPPELAAVRRVDELNRNTQLRSGPPHAAF